MFTETNKGFTIITNFGCDNRCPYCISKHHPLLQNEVTNIKDINWNYLEECIKNSKSPKVNLSGGGDPLYKYNEHLDFYNKVYDICKRNNKLMDVHTRVFIKDNDTLLSKFNKIAMTIEFNNELAFKELKENFNNLSSLTNLRVIQVVNKDFTVEKCKEYINKLKHIGIKQITFREMFGNKNANKWFNTLKKHIEEKDGIYFLKDGEYHDYYFTNNNKLYPYFFGNFKDDRDKMRKRYEEVEQECM